LKNIFVEACTSGEMIKNHFRRFYEQISGENIDERALLLVDSWAGHKDSNTIKLFLPMAVLIVPERVTECLAS
jgi:hypothetical protein